MTRDTDRSPQGGNAVGGAVRSTRAGADRHRPGSGTQPPENADLAVTQEDRDAALTAALGVAAPDGGRSNEDSGRGEGWQSLENAPVACHVLATRFDADVGEWVIAVVASPPSKPFTHWRMLPAMPDATPTDQPATGDGAEDVVEATIDRMIDAGVKSDGWPGLPRDVLRALARAALTSRAVVPGMVKSVRLAKMYLETGFIECDQCGHEVPTKNTDAEYELARALSAVPTPEGE